jgi:hypothetical protein
MTPGPRTLVPLACSVLLLFVCGFGADSAANKISADFIVTAAPAYEPLAALRSAERFPRGAQLLLVRDGIPELLVAGFASTADANVSFDAARVLFAGKKNANDPWQIWQLTFADRSLHQLTSSPYDAIRPLYLPGGRFVFAQHTPAGFQLISAPLDPPADHIPLLPLTYAAASAIPADVLADGRVLFEAGFPLGSGVTPELFLVYSDGSGVESYRCDHGIARWGGKQLASGDIVFSQGVYLARFTSPLAHAERIPAPHADYAGSIVETKESDWLLSAKAASDKHYVLKLWKLGTANLQIVLSQPGADLVEPVLLAPRPTPKRHPSALHPWDYANLLALDARITRDAALQGVPTSVRVEMKDTSGHSIALGTSPVESDGSYFVKVPGDQPIRFALLDAKGHLLRQEHGWFWARAGEQRICVGCHAGPEHAPGNRVPAVLLRSTTPTDLTAPPTTAPQPTTAGGR